MFLVIGILSALLEVKVSGKGQVIDSAITDGSAHLMSMLYTFSKAGLWRNVRESNLLDGGAPYYRPYETADGKHVSVGAIESKFFAQLITLLGLSKEFILLRQSSTLITKQEILTLRSMGKASRHQRLNSVERVVIYHLLRQLRELILRRFCPIGGLIRIPLMTLRKISFLTDKPVKNTLYCIKNQ